MSAGTTLEFRQVVGSGGFGTVYRATLRRAKDFRKEVAVKVLHDRWLDDASVTARMRDEARVLGLVRHRAIPAIDGLFWVQGRPALVVEFVDGVTLQQLRALGPVPPTVALEICTEMSSALHTAWAAQGPDGAPLNLIHRDIKPGNLQVTPAGEVKILDFGIARAEFEGREVETVDQSVLGSVRYMAPERLDFVHGPKGDVYAVGVVLAEIVLGRKLERTSADRDRHAAFLKGLVEDFGFVDDLQTRSLLPLVLDLLAWDPDDRPTAKVLERRCRELRSRRSGTSLAEWAEEVVPAAMAAAPAMEEPTNLDLLGKVLAASPQGGTEPPSPRSDPGATVTRIPPGALGWYAGAVLAGSLIGLFGVVLVLAVVVRSRAGTRVEVPEVVEPVVGSVATPPSAPAPVERETDPVAAPVPAPVPAPSPVPSPLPSPAPVALAPSTLPAPSAASGAPVTSAAFARFVETHPEWTRDEAIARRRASEGYLAGWVGPTPPPGQGAVVGVSWSAASAYCADRGGLAPLEAPPVTWTEGAGPFQEWRAAEGNGAAWRRFDGATSTAARRTDANQFTGFRCVR